MSYRETRVTTLADCGVSISPDTTGSSKTELTIIRNRTALGITYLATVGRNFPGPILASVLNTLAKEPRSIDAEGIVADINLPEQARQRFASQNTIKLDREHRKSFFGTQYSEMDKYHCAKWVKVLREGNHSNLARMFVAYKTLNRRTVEAMLQDSLNENGVLPILRDEYFQLFGQDRIKAINAMAASTLTPEENRAIVIAKGMRNYQTVVDLTMGHIYPAIYFHPDTFSLDGNRVHYREAFFSESQMTADFVAQISTEGDIRWSIEDYSYPENRYPSDSLDNCKLRPVIAWRKSPTDREYISQPAARRFRDFPIDGDVLAGRVLAAYFTPGITNRWLEAMPMNKDGRKNKITGTQVAILASLPQPNFGGRVLRDENGVLAKLERAFAAQ